MVVGTHSGISIGEDGPSQMSVEDLSLACSLAGFTVLSPADEVAMFALVKAAAYHPGAVFIRAGRVKAPVIYGPEQEFVIGKGIQLTEGNDLTFISTGLLVAECLRAAETLAAEGIAARVIDLHTIKPLDRELIAKAAAKKTPAMPPAPPPHGQQQQPPPGQQTPRPGQPPLPGSPQYVDMDNHLLPAPPTAHINAAELKVREFGNEMTENFPLSARRHFGGRVEYAFPRCAKSWGVSE